MSRSRTSNSVGATPKKIVVLTAPSGSGKTSIARRLMEWLPELHFSVSATTRPKRSYERDGVDYHFVSPEEFEHLKEQGDLLEYEEVYPGRFYGTLRSEVEKSAERGPVLLDIEVNGASNVKRAFPEESFVVFIRPPSVEELERRLESRGSEDRQSFKDRMDRAKLELEFADRFDAVVVNDDLERAAIETLEIVRSFLKKPTAKRAKRASGGSDAGTRNERDESERP